MKNIYDRLKILTNQLKQERKRLLFVKQNIDSLTRKNLMNDDYYEQVELYNSISEKITALEKQFASVSKLKFEYSLELEFEKRKRTHKYVTIITTLALFEQKGIYNHRLLIQKYGTMDTSGAERAFYVTEELQNGDSKIYDKVYEMCWKKLRNIIPNTIVFDMQELPEE